MLITFTVRHLFAPFSALAKYNSAEPSAQPALEIRLKTGFYRGVYSKENGVKWISRQANNDLGLLLSPDDGVKWRGKTANLISGLSQEALPANK